MLHFRARWAPSPHPPATQALNLVVQAAQAWPPIILHDALMRRVKQREGRRPTYHPPSEWGPGALCIWTSQGKRYAHGHGHRDRPSLPTAWDFPSPSTAPEDRGFLSRDHDLPLHTD
uniref:Uncharacterized protein n=1 Tax=Eutreptiella gymnastica TaxID=73025 RepID=A0A7S4GBE3_9EUGL